MKRTPQARVIRRALGLSQEEFATRFHIPLGTLRDWEQGRKEPDAAARAYLVVIGRNPSAVAKAFGVDLPLAELYEGIDIDDEGSEAPDQDAPA